MTKLFLGDEIARPFLPTSDFNASKRFYQALGFTLLLDGEVAIFHAGKSSFIPQNRFQQEWAGNSMMQLMMDDLDAWWERIASLDLPGRFGISTVKPPSPQPWGLRVAYLSDPAGVLWHIAERRPGVEHDR